MAASDPQPPTDYRIVKTEIFDANMMLALSEHDGVPADIKRALKAYRKSATNGNQVSIVYEFGKKWAAIRRGRLGPQRGLGLQTFRSDIRAALAARYYWDVDVVNAQPNILVALCKQRGWACEALEEYTRARADKLAELMAELDCDRDDAKRFCLTILFGATPYKKVPAYYQQLATELARIADNCAIAFPDIYKICAADKSKANLKASCLAVVAQDKEREVLLCIDEFLKTKGRTFSCLIHDGGLVLKEEDETEFPSEMLREAEAHVLQALGFRIRLEVKPMTHSFEVKEERLVPTSVVISDSWAAKQFVELLGPNVVLDRTGLRYIFDDTTGLWSTDETTLKRWLNRFANRMVFKQDSASGIRTFDYSGKEVAIQAMMKNMNRHLEPVDFVNTRANSAIGKLLFADGILDMDTMEFNPGFDPAYFFFGRIPRPFPYERNEALIERVEKLLFEDPYLEDQAEQARFYKIGLARAIYGDYQAKRCYTSVGEPNCGRGLLTGALIAAFGDYVTTFDSNNLLFNPRDGADKAKQNAWLVPIANARLAIGNEICLTGTRFIDGNKLKSICSGGDIIKGRLNHKDESPFVCRATFLLQTNDMPSIKPADKGVLNRLCVNELKKSYSLTPEPGNPRHMLQDSTLKMRFETEEYMNALFYVMMDAWLEFVDMGRVYEKPACIAEATSEWIETNASVRSLLEEAFEITKDENDYVAVRDIIKYLREKGCADSDTKIGREMNTMGCPPVDRKVAGVTKRVRIGIRRIPSGEPSME